MHSKPMILRLGIPKTSGTFPTVARRIGAAVMVSAGALWVPSAEQFWLPSGRCALLDIAIDSSGFVRHAYQGGYPWSVAPVALDASGQSLRAPALNRRARKTPSSQPRTQPTRFPPLTSSPPPAV